MSVPVSTSSDFTPGTPVRLFQTSDDLLDVMPDGRFLLQRVNPPATVTQLEVVFNWFEEVRRKSLPR